MARALTLPTSTVKIKLVKPTKSPKTTPRGQRSKPYRGQGRP